MNAKKPNFAFAYNASRRLLAVVFLLSGVSKLFSLNSFASEVQQYSELYVGSVFVSWSGVIAFAVFCIEIVLGMDLSFARTSAIASMGVLVLMTFFLYLTGVNTKSGYSSIHLDCYDVIYYNGTYQTVQNGKKQGVSWANVNSSKPKHEHQCSFCSENI